MKNEFQPGVMVRWNIPDGGLARITRYLGDGWYEVQTVPDQRLLIGREDELVLAKPFKAEPERVPE